LRSVVVRTEGNVSNDTVGRRAELLKKIEASKGASGGRKPALSRGRLRIKTLAATKSG
jgi:hypothetical protein